MLKLLESVWLIVDRWYLLLMQMNYKIDMMNIIMRMMMMTMTRNGEVRKSKFSLQKLVGDVVGVAKELQYEENVFETYLKLSKKG